MLKYRIPIFRSPFRTYPITKHLDPPQISMVNTRANAYTWSHISSVSEGTASAHESLNDRRRRWAQLLHHQHYQPLITEVLEEELPKYQHSTVIKAADMAENMRECALILASASPILTAAVGGNLVAGILQEPDLQDTYKTIFERGHHQPSIYAHFLTDRYGVPPTPNQYLIIRDMVRDYLIQNESSEHSWQIDNITPPLVTKRASNRGHRKYLHTSDRSSKRVETLQRFCAGAQARWLETPAQLRDTPFSYPPAECGYSKASHIRLAQHRARQSSNYVMNLVEDICTYLHRTAIFEQHFSMHAFIIYLIFRPSQAALAEIFCSGLLQVWVEGGGGFNAYPAGRSVATARRVSEGEWAGHERYVRLESLVVLNMREQQRKADQWREALNWEEKRAGDEGVEKGGREEGAEADCM